MQKRVRYVNDRRSTPASIYAGDIAERILEAKHPFTMQFNTGEDTLKIADRIRRILPAEVRDTIMVTSRPYYIIVGTKQKSQVELYTDMIRRLAMHVDDDNLYDEAMALLGMEVS